MAVPIDLPVLDVANPVITQSTRLPDGDITLAHPIIAKNLEKIHLVGGNRSRIIWSGDPAIGAIQFHGIRHGSIGGAGPLGFEILAARDGTRAAVLITNSDVPSGFISTSIVVEGVNIRHGGYQTAFDIGFSVDSYAGDPAKIKGGNNNENHRFIRCGVESCKVAAYHIRGHQTWDTTFIECGGHDTGRVDPATGTNTKCWIYGVWAEEGASIIAKNCQFNRAKCDYFLGWPTTRLTVEGGNSEHCQQFVSNIVRNPLTGVVEKLATSGDYYIHIRDQRFDCEPLETMPVIDLCGRGPITVANSFFFGINGVSPRFDCTNYYANVNGLPVYFRGRLDLSGVTFGQSGGVLPTGPIVKTPPTWTPRLFGVEHKFIDNAGKVHWRPVVANQPLQAAVEN